jgi:predicted oxidoreductase
MERTNLGDSTLQSSRLVYGCMRIAGDNSESDRKRGKAAIRAALEAGYNHFDHADIYGGGHCESLFGEVLKETPGLRDELIITSKCGVRLQGEPKPGDPQRYDFSFDHIVDSVDCSLDRLGIEKLDLLLLHRPDFLFDPGQVAQAFQVLQESGKVRHFGVSNFRPSQVLLLRANIPDPLLVNQVEINIHNVDSLLDGTLDQCQEFSISPQAWCPLGGVAYPAWGNTFSAEEEARIGAEFERQSEIYDAEPWLIMLAWLLRHPSGIFPIIGSTTPARIMAARQALNIRYTREDWYRLFEARNGRPVP